MNVWVGLAGNDDARLVVVGAGVVAGLDEAANVDVLWIGSIAGDEDRLDVVGALCVVGRDAGASVVVCRAVVCAAVVAGDGPKLGHHQGGGAGVGASMGAGVDTRCHHGADDGDVAGGGTNVRGGTGELVGGLRGPS